MFLKFRNSSDKHSSAQVAGKAPAFTQADFLPFAYHLDAHTLLTKNGELLQILRIATDAEGRDYEAGNGQALLRETLRSTVMEHAASEAYAFWIHTVRRRAPIPHIPAFSEPAAQALHADWQKAHPWTHSYRNEVYISILQRGQTADLFNIHDFKQGLLPGRHRHYRQDFVERSQLQLEQVVTAVMRTFSSQFQAERLSIVEREHIAYSEPLEFLHFLVNLESASMPVTDMDISRQLATHELTFGFDAMESRLDAKNRRFGAMLSLKGCPELPVHALDRCLQLPEEYIITQTVGFLPADKALKQQENIRDMLETSPDDTILNASGLSAMLSGLEEHPADFAEQHTSILIIRDIYSTLDESVGRMQQAFSTLGLITVREDIMLEEAFWAQLPGNFEFIRRQSTIPSLRMAGFARLNYFPCGEEKSPWGGAVAVLPTTLETPYAFHFHVGDNGHSALLDFNSFTDARGAILTNFLAASTRQYGGRLIVLDRHFSARPLVQSLGGHYSQLTPGRGAAGVELNPLSLPDSPRNRAFLTAWLSHFVASDALPSAALRDILDQGLAEIFSLAPAERNLGRARAHPVLVTAIMHDDAAVFSKGVDTLDFSGAVVGMDVSSLMTHPTMALPVFSYLLHRLIMTLDGAPTLIVLHEAWDMLDNDFFAARIVSLLDMLTRNNAALLFTTRHFAEHADSYFTQELLPHLSTTLILPDDIATDYMPSVLGLSAQQEQNLSRLERQKGEFLVRHGVETVACALPLNGLDMHLPLLSGDTTALRLAQIRTRGDYA